MFDLKKLEDNNAIFWIFKFPEYRKIAAECGWAIAIHGSAVHDNSIGGICPWKTGITVDKRDHAVIVRGYQKERYI